MSEKTVKTKKRIRQAVAAAVILGLGTLPYWSGEYIVLLGLLSLLYMSLGQMWNLLAGYAGLVSLGQQLFIGLGGYALAVTTEYYNMPVAAGLLLGGLISAGIAALEALLFFRMKGMYFAVATWVMAEAFVILFGNWNYVKSGVGMFVKAAYWYNTADIYYFALLIAAFVFLLVNGILRSRPGLELMAMRDNDEAAAASGINLFAAKLFAFIVSGFMTGVIGGLFYLQQVSLQPKSAFSMAWTVAAVFIVVIGGLGTVAGPIVGAILHVILVQLLSNFAGISMILLGAIAIAVMLFMPKGIVGTLQNRHGFELFSPRRIVE